MEGGSSSGNGGASGAGGVAVTAEQAAAPLVFAKGQPGSEVLHPVAVVIVGGLISSTLLDIVITPTLFFRFGRKSADAQAEPDQEIDRV